MKRYAYFLFIQLLIIGVCFTGNYSALAQGFEDLPLEPREFETEEELMRLWKIPQKTKGLTPRSLNTATIVYDPAPPTKLGVNFEPNSFQLSSDKKTLSQLRIMANVMKKVPEYFLEIAGHTDTKGDEKYNLWLSYQRANAVKEYIVSKYQINEKRLIVSAHGEYHPLRKGNNKKDHAVNRRVQCRPILSEKR